MPIVSKSSIELDKKEIIRPLLHSLASPPGSPAEGEYYWNNMNKKLFVFDGTNWIEYIRGPRTIQTSNSSLSFQLDPESMLQKIVTICSNSANITIGLTSGGSELLSSFPVSAGQSNVFSIDLFSETSLNVFIGGLSGNTKVKLYIS